MAYLLFLIVRSLARLLAGLRSDSGAKDLEILILRHQLKVLRRKTGNVLYAQPNWVSHIDTTRPESVNNRSRTRLTPTSQASTTPECCARTTTPNVRVSTA
jgi:hypothetical protein